MRPIRAAYLVRIWHHSIKLLVADVGRARACKPAAEAKRCKPASAGFMKPAGCKCSAIAHIGQCRRRFARTARQARCPVIPRQIATSRRARCGHSDRFDFAIRSGIETEGGNHFGQAEAAWAFQRRDHRPELVQAPLLLLDVGGAGTNSFLARANARILRTASRSHRAAPGEISEQRPADARAEFSGCATG